MDENNYKVAVVGGGSWATAIVKMLCENMDRVGWYIRSEAAADHLRREHHNPNYLSAVEFDPSKLCISNNINEIVENAYTVIFAIPSAFFAKEIRGMKVSMKGKILFSAIKGLLPEKNIVMGQYLSKRFKVAPGRIGAITGPCHAEEVAMEHLSYLTVACQNQPIAENMASYLTGPYICCKLSRDVVGVEYAAVLKNIYAVAAGIAHGLNYGDNFQAVLMSNSIREMDRFMTEIYPMEGRNIMDSAYLGDLLVTGYSYFSRNRMFGTMVGKGYTVKSAMLEMNMVAEGYYATYGVAQLIKQHDLRMPIVEAVYAILYEGKDRRDEFKKLTAYLD